MSAAHVRALADGLDLDAVRARISSEREAAEAAADRLSTSLRVTAAQLRSAGLTFAQIGDVLGVGVPRVSQLLTR